MMQDERDELYTQWRMALQIAWDYTMQRGDLIDWSKHKELWNRTHALRQAYQEA